MYHYDVVCIKDLHGAVRALEALSRPLSSALRVPRPQVLPKVADAPAGYEAADVTLGNLGDHPHITYDVRIVLTQSQSRCIEHETGD